MPQIEGRTPTTQHNLASNRPTSLAENQKIERRSDGSVWLVETLPEGKGPDRRESRVDSPADLDFAAKGGVLWYAKYLTKAKVATPVTKKEAK